MRGLVFTGEPGKIELRADLKRPRVESENDAILAVRVAGICGSDLHVFACREPCDAGCIFGHEAVGTVVACGDAAHHLLGKTFILPFTSSCGDCFFCLSNLSARCTSSQLFGWRLNGRGLHGAQAEFVRVPLASTTLVSLPLDMHPEEGLLLGDIFTTALFAVANAGVAGAHPDGSGSPVSAVKALLASANIDVDALASAAEASAAAAIVADVQDDGSDDGDTTARTDGSVGPASVGPPASAHAPALARTATISPSSLPKLAIKAASVAAVSELHRGPEAAPLPVRLLPPPVLVVVGCGPVGLLAIVAARTCLALRSWGWTVNGGDSGERGWLSRLHPLIFAVDSVPARLDAAARAGAIPLDLGALGTEGVAAAVQAASAGRKDWLARGAAAAASLAQPPQPDGAASGSDGCCDAAASEGAGAGASPAAPPAPPSPSLLPLGDDGTMASLAWHGQGADAVIEAVGGEAPLGLAYALLRPGGALSSCGVHTGPGWPFPPGACYDKNITYRSGRCPARSLLPLATAVMRVYKARAARDASCPPLRSLLFTHRFPLSKGVKAYALFAGRRDGIVKACLYPDPSLMPREEEDDTAAGQVRR